MTSAGSIAIGIGMPLPLRLYFPSYAILVSIGTFAKKINAIPRQSKKAKTHNLVFILTARLPNRRSSWVGLWEIHPPSEHSIPLLPWLVPCAPSKFCTLTNSTLFLSTCNQYLVPKSQLKKMPIIAENEHTDRHRRTGIESRTHCSYIRSRIALGFSTRKT